MTLVNESLGERFQIVRLLGRGGMSDVYEALDVQRGHRVAIKLLRSSDPEFVRRLAQEARALAGFQHPGLVRLFEAGLAADQAYLIMEFVEGTTLAESLRERSRLSPEETASLGVALGEALAYVHERGVVHRDVKPSNILMSPGGVAKLSDFGVAQVHDAATLTVAGSMLGTVSYMAPEQLEDAQVGTSADVWSLGIVLLECLIGRRVYEGSPSEIVARRLRDPIPLPADLPVPWKILFGGMLDHRPDQRLSASEVAALLATSPYPAPWSAHFAERGGATYDLTALAPGADATTVVGSLRGAPADATRIARAPIASGVRPQRRRVSWRPIASGAVGLAIVATGLGLWLSSGPAHDPGHGTKRTTTTLPSPSASLSALVSDMALAQSAGRIGPSHEQGIASAAEEAVATDSAGNAVGAGYDLQRAQTTIVNGIQAATITQAEGATLLHALSVLSLALGVSIPPTTTTTSTTSTTTTTTTTPVPGFGGFGGPGNGNPNG
ncbi:MAG TPA: serine/threonine-protein kinase [Acidimicrobiales bacterium]|nr:serine/threonine-protein kinase [Acidimicrobiales bacterium]